MSSLLPNQVIYSGHMTEKASLVGQFANAYVFKVNPKASKLEVKKAIQDEYKVKVNKVNIVNVKLRREERFQKNLIGRKHTLLCKREIE